MEMPFDKHKGMKLEDVPKHYLLWILDNSEIKSPTLEVEIKKVLGLEPGTAADTRPSALDIKTVYRRMAAKHHLDRGGSTEAMVAVNEFWEEITKLLVQPSHPDFFA